MGFNYHMIIFSDFCYEPTFQFAMGYVYAGLLLLCAFVNLAHMTMKNIETGRRKRKIDALRRSYTARLDAFLSQ